MVRVLFTSNATTDARLFTPSKEPDKDIRRRLNEWRARPPGTISISQSLTP